MTRLDYTKLDAALLEAIRAGVAHLPGIFSVAAVKAAAKELEAQKHWWRFVDARLQALRKAGKIRYAGRNDGWKLVNGGAA